MGVKPADVRKTEFDGGEGKGRGMVNRSIPITSLSFLEMRFVCPGKTGKKPAPELRKAAREISGKIGSGFRALKL